MPDAQTLIANAMKEADLQRLVIELAEMLGYEVVHINDSRGQKAVGLPDLMLMRAPRPLVWLELKTEKGKASPKQEWFLEELRQSGNVAWVIRPTDWLNGMVERLLLAQDPGA
jgi:hypothetical protein